MRKSNTVVPDPEDDSQACCTKISITSFQKGSEQGDKQPLANPKISPEA